MRHFNDAERAALIAKNITDGSADAKNTAIKTAYNTYKPYLEAYEAAAAVVTGDDNELAWLFSEALAGIEATGAGNFAVLRELVASAAYPDIDKLLKVTSATLGSSGAALRVAITPGHYDLLLLAGNKATGTLLGVGYVYFTEITSGQNIKTITVKPLYPEFEFFEDADGVFNGSDETPISLTESVNGDYLTVARKSDLIMKVAFPKRISKGFFQVINSDSDRGAFTNSALSNCTAWDILQNIQRMPDTLLYCLRTGSNDNGGYAISNIIRTLLGGIQLDTPLNPDLSMSPRSFGRLKGIDNAGSVIIMENNVRLVHPDLLESTYWYNGFASINPVTNTRTESQSALSYFDMESNIRGQPTSQVRTQGRPAFIFPMPDSDVTAAVDFQLNICNPVFPDSELIGYGMVAGLTAATYTRNFWTIRNGLNGGVHAQTSDGLFSTGGAFKVKVGAIAQDDPDLLVVNP
jgi:hypothetical protein